MCGSRGINPGTLGLRKSSRVKELTKLRKREIKMFTECRHIRLGDCNAILTAISPTLHYTQKGLCVISSLRVVFCHQTNRTHELNGTAKIKE